MKCLVLDLEMNQPSGKIIQIGAAVINAMTFDVKPEKFSVFINPKEELNKEIVELCSITQEMVNSGYNIVDGVDMLLQFKKKYKCSKNIIAWGGTIYGGNDVLKLKQSAEQAGYPKEILDKNFGYRYVDVKSLYQLWATANQKNKNVGVGQASEIIGLGRFNGIMHRADDDAYNTALIYSLLLRKMRGE